MIITAMIVVGLSLMLQHWLPWRKLPWSGGRNLPHRISAFVMGVATIQGALTWVFLSWGNLEAVLALWAITITGGFVTVLVYGVDWILNLRQERNEALEREQMIWEQNHQDD